MKRGAFLLVSALALTAAAADSLNPRLEEVLASLVKGFNNTEIASQLGISRTVVKEHVENLLLKLEAANRTEAAAIALRKGLVKV